MLYTWDGISWNHIQLDLEISESGFGFCVYSRTGGTATLYFRNFLGSYISTSMGWNILKLGIQLDLAISCYWLGFWSTLLNSLSCCAVILTISAIAISQILCDRILLNLIFKTFIKNYIVSSLALFIQQESASMLCFWRIPSAISRYLRYGYFPKCNM